MIAHCVVWLVLFCAAEAEGRRRKGKLADDEDAVDGEEEDNRIEEHKTDMTSQPDTKRPKLDTQPSTGI
jgi:hypothetical protein